MVKFNLNFIISNPDDSDDSGIECDNDEGLENIDLKKYKITGITFKEITDKLISYIDKNKSGDMIDSTDCNLPNLNYQSSKSKNLGWLGLEIFQGKDKKKGNICLEMGIHIDMIEKSSLKNFRKLVEKLRDAKKSK